MGTQYEDVPKEYGEKPNEPPYQGVELTKPPKDLGEEVLEFLDRSKNWEP